MSTNEKLDLDLRVALALASKMVPGLEERFGIDPVVPPDAPPLAREDIDQLFTQNTMQWTDLAELEKKIEGCLDEYTNFNELDPDTEKKGSLEEYYSADCFHQLCDARYLLGSRWSYLKRFISHQRM